MHWTEAVNKSYSNMAERVDKRTKRVFLRTADGDAHYIHKGNLIRAFPETVEGYDDWYPVCPKSLGDE